MNDAGPVATQPWPPLPAHLDPVCARFEAACQSTSPTGPLPRPEDYLGETPPPDRAVLLHELVALELAYRRRRGEALATAAYRERFPELDPAWLDRELRAAEAALTAPFEKKTAPGGTEAALAPAGERLSFPEVVGGYRLLRPLGKGGMGTVYEAEGSSGQRVAIKLISPDFIESGEAVERFRQEGRLASTLVHPRCVFVLAADEDAGQPYIVMELMPGETLKLEFGREGKTLKQEREVCAQGEGRESQKSPHVASATTAEVGETRDIIPWR